MSINTDYIKVDRAWTSLTSRLQCYSRNQLRHHDNSDTVYFLKQIKVLATTTTTTTTVWKNSNPFSWAVHTVNNFFNCSRFSRRHSPENSDRSKLQTENKWSENTIDPPESKHIQSLHYSAAFFFWLVFIVCFFFFFCGLWSITN